MMKHGNKKFNSVRNETRLPYFNSNASYIKCREFGDVYNKLYSSGYHPINLLWGHILDEIHYKVRLNC